MGTLTTTHALYRLHELTIRTLYSEVKERANVAGDLLPGTPGTLVKRAGTGHEYWYRSYYPVPKKRCEEFVGAASNEKAYQAMQQRIAYSDWTARQVSALSKLGYQVADKGVASVLVELHNRKIFEGGLVVVGTLAYMSWLNEYGARATAARTQDIDLARRQTLKLATTVPFLSSMQATQLPFARIPGLPSDKPSTSVKLPGAEGLRVDILAPGPVLGKIIAVPELEWHAQAIPYYDYLLEGSRAAAMLAGGHCIPIQLPQATRMVWHKLYASTRRTKEPTKAEKDLVQAVTLAAILIEQDSVALHESFRSAPRELRAAALSRMPRIETMLAEHPQALDGFRELQ
ncbi:MAG: GSU2403 family nucleotidyltransferase fold protein [Steroidobacteraceae bacterium]